MHPQTHPNIKAGFFAKTAKDCANEERHITCHVCLDKKRRKIFCNRPRFSGRRCNQNHREHSSPPPGMLPSPSDTPVSFFTISPLFCWKSNTPLLLPPFSEFSSLFRLTLEWPLSFVQIPGKCLSHVICRSSDSQNICRLPAPSFCTRLTGHSSQTSPSSTPTPRGKKKNLRLIRGRSTNKSTAI